MLAAILFCGAMMTSCNKEENKDNNNTPDITKADMAGTWEGTFQGIITVGGNSENFTISWVLTLGPEGSGTSNLKYTAKFTTLDDVANEVYVSDYYPIQNTSQGRIMLLNHMPAGIVENAIDFDIDLKAKTMTGDLRVNLSGEGDELVTIGGNTTLKKK